MKCEVRKICGEKIDFLSVVDVADHPTEKGGEQE